MLFFRRGGGYCGQKGWKAVCSRLPGKGGMVKGKMRKETAEKLAQYMKEYPLVVIVDKNLREYGKYVKAICTHGMQGKILFLFHSGRKNPDFTGVRYAICLQEGEYEEIESLYYMYEFSCHIRMLEEGGRFGSLINYVKEGILTEEEAAEAFLHL